MYSCVNKTKNKQAKFAFWLFGAILVIVVTFEIYVTFWSIGNGAPSAADKVVIIISFIAMLTIVLIEWVPILALIYRQMREKITIDDGGLVIKTGESCVTVKWAEIREVGIKFESSTVTACYYLIYLSKEILSDMERVNISESIGSRKIFKQPYVSFLLPDEKRSVDLCKSYLPQYCNMLNLALQSPNVSKQRSDLYRAYPCIYTFDGRKMHHIAEKEHARLRKMLDKQGKLREWVTSVLFVCSLVLHPMITLLLTVGFN